MGIALRIVAALVGLAVVLALGIALGMALHDNPRPGAPITVEHTVQVGTPPATTSAAGAAGTTGP